MRGHSEYEFPTSKSKTSDSSVYSDEDILATLRTCYAGGIAQPNTNRVCAALLRKYGIDPDELMEKTRYRKGAAKTDAAGKEIKDKQKKTVFEKIPCIKTVKRYTNPGQIIGGLKMEAFKRPAVLELLLAEGIIKRKAAVTPIAETEEEIDLHEEPIDPDEMGVVEAVTE